MLENRLFQINSRFVRDNSAQGPVPSRYCYQHQSIQICLVKNKKIDSHNS